MTLNKISNIILFSIIILNINHVQSMNYKTNTYNSKSVDYTTQHSTHNAQTPRFQNIFNVFYNYNLSLNSKSNEIYNNNNIEYIFTFKNQSKYNSSNMRPCKNRKINC